MHIKTIQTFEINLNIHYFTPPAFWKKLEQLYTQIFYRRGIKDGCPQWYSKGKKQIVAGVESSGLTVYAELTEPEWQEWIFLFFQKASDLLGYAVDNRKKDLILYLIDNGKRERKKENELLFAETRSGRRNRRKQ